MLGLVALVVLSSDPVTMFECKGPPLEKLQVLKQRVRASFGDAPVKAEWCSCKAYRCWQSVTVLLQQTPFTVEYTATSTWTVPQEDAAFVTPYLQRVRALPVVRELAAEGPVHCNLRLWAPDHRPPDLRCVSDASSVSIVDTLEVGYVVRGSVLARASPAAFETGRALPAVEAIATSKETWVTLRNRCMLFHQDERFVWVVFASPNDFTVTQTQEGRTPPDLCR